MRCFLFYTEWVFNTDWIYKLVQSVFTKSSLSLARYEFQSLTLAYNEIQFGFTSIFTKPSLNIFNCVACLNIGKICKIRG